MTDDMGCSLSVDGGPGMYESGPFGQGSPTPVPIAVESFHALQHAGSAATGGAGRSQVNLLNWDPNGAAAGSPGASAQQGCGPAMKLLSRVRERSSATTMRDRLVWQSASLLLAYPDDGLAERLHMVDALRAHQTGPAAALLGRTVAELRALAPMAAAAQYVETFDMRRRSTMYLTYWTAGDTRNRGREMLAFATAYRDAGVKPPRTEAPDYLPVVLEFAATVDPEAGRRLLTEHRVPIDVLRGALADAKSPYEYTVAAICETLPAATNQEVRRAQRLAQSGPPAEAVGLQPFTLTVPPKRAEGA